MRTVWIYLHLHIGEQRGACIRCRKMWKNLLPIWWSAVAPNVFFPQTIMYELCFKTNLKSIRPLQISMCNSFRRTHNPKIEFLRYFIKGPFTLMCINIGWYRSTTRTKNILPVSNMFLGGVRSPKPQGRSFGIQTLCKKKIWVKKLFQKISKLFSEKNFEKFSNFFSKNLAGNFLKTFRVEKFLKKSTFFSTFNFFPTFRKFWFFEIFDFSKKMKKVLKIFEKIFWLKVLFFVKFVFFVGFWKTLRKAYQ